MDPLTLMISMIVLLVLSIIGYIFYKERQGSTPIAGKPAALKKQEIIAGYQKEMEALLKRYGDEKSACMNEKKKILQRINRELATNIFFDHDEARTVLNELACYEVKEV